MLTPLFLLQDTAGSHGKLGLAAVILGMIQVGSYLYLTTFKRTKKTNDLEIKILWVSIYRTTKGNQLKPQASGHALS